MNKKKHLTTTAALRLKREDSYDTWVLMWPPAIQDGALATLTHDEILRFPGLQDFLKDRVGSLKVNMTLEISEPKL